MWTPTIRRQHSRDHLRYGSDLTDREWEIDVVGDRSEQVEVIASGDPHQRGCVAGLLHIERAIGEKLERHRGPHRCKT